jgi:hypothetical protein
MKKQKIPNPHFFLSCVCPAADRIQMAALRDLNPGLSALLLLRLLLC